MKTALLAIMVTVGLTGCVTSVTTISRDYMFGAKDESETASVPRAQDQRAHDALRVAS